mgnify:CR=1 FL=1
MPRPLRTVCRISIHALREEGDTLTQLGTIIDHNFYPRPPRGGRPMPDKATVEATIFLSTPSARRATAGHRDRNRGSPISIHALREEGDLESYIQSPAVEEFLSTPSARRATRQRRPAHQGCGDFYPRPPRGGRLVKSGYDLKVIEISIHALREEGDISFYLSDYALSISIHALREEGDSKNRDKISIFKQIIQHSARI